jgi:acetyl-CoA carboxylase biotin carboxyl carrier protein
MMDDVARIEALAAILREYDLDSIKIRLGEDEIEVVRRSAVPAIAIDPSSAVAAGELAPAASPNVKKVTAPVVGIFYRSSSPAEEPFVEVGDRVEDGDTLCVLEAMKIFNEIASDYAGVVTRIVPENGELVAVGDELFWIEP